MKMTKEQAMIEYIDKIKSLDKAWIPEGTRARFAYVLLFSA